MAQKFLYRTRLFLYTLSPLAALALPATSDATIVGAKSFGDELAGGRIIVTFAQQGVHAAPIVAGGLEQGMASLPGLFDFSVTGDTFLSEWSLTNSTTFDTIRLVEFDLAGTISPGSPEAPGPHSPGVLFDDGKPFPNDTANGYAGRAGAVQVNVGAPTIINSFEVTPWADPMNAGDEYVGEVIEYNGFGPLMTSVWRDDTDIVGIDTGRETPEPSSALLVLAAAIGIGCCHRGAGPR